jgi:hypothetical protein
MNYKVKTIEKLLDRKYQTIRMYLDRSEFQHIVIKQSKYGDKYFANVSDEDLALLQRLIGSKTKRGKWIYKMK